MIHGDSVYDIIDKQDHASIQSELMRGLQPENTSASILDNGNEKRIFLCRMNVSRNARRQMRFGDQKVTYFYEVEEYHTKSYKFKECLEQDWVKSSKKRKIKITHLFFGGQRKAD